MKPSNQSIGVFDSGLGGLSILQALQLELPSAHFVYFSDAGNAPYGERGDAFVIERSLAIAHYLIQKQHVKALVVACNTATAAAINLLRQTYIDFPLIGVEPALKPAAAYSQSRRIGVIGTQGTLQSARFQALKNTLVQQFEGQIEFVTQACPGLAYAIETDDSQAIESLSQTYLQAMGEFGTHAGAIDTLVLGCTHYLFAHDVLRALLPASVRLMETGVPVARQVKRLLALQPNDAAFVSASPPTNLQLLTTGSCQRLEIAVQRWLQISTTANAVLI